MNTDPYFWQKEFSDQIRSIRNELTEIRKNRNCDEMWDNSDIIKNWKVSSRTLATWRAEGKIEYVQVGSKIWYPREAREVFIESNLIRRRETDDAEEN